MARTEDKWVEHLLQAIQRRLVAKQAMITGADKITIEIYCRKDGNFEIAVISTSR